MSNSSTHEIRDSVIIGALSLGVALMSGSLVIRIIHTHSTSAGWKDTLDAGDPVSNLIAIIAITGVAYTLLTRIKNRYGLIAALEGACWLIGSIPVLFWVIDRGRSLPDISNSRYLGLGLVVTAICLGIIRSKLAKSNLPCLGGPSHDGDVSTAKEGEDEPSPHQPVGGREKSNTTGRTWMLGLAAIAAIVVSALVPQSFPLLPPKSAPDPADNCRSWYNTEVVALYEGRVALWNEWHKSLGAQLEEPGRTKQVLAEIDAGMAPAALLDRPEVLRRFSALQDAREVEAAMAMLDGHVDDNEIRRIAEVRLSELHALMDVLTSDILLADTAGFYPFSGAQSLETDLTRAALGLAEACDLEPNN